MRVLSWTIRTFKYKPESGKFATGSENNVSTKIVQKSTGTKATPNEKTTIYQYTKQQRFYD